MFRHWKDKVRKRKKLDAGPVLSSQVRQLPNSQAESTTKASGSQQSVLSDPPRQEYGLFTLVNPSTDDQSTATIDIIAIHGLNGHKTRTWTHDNGTLWLRDLLPLDVPGCRVSTYGYPSELFFSASTAGVRDFARRLLASLSYVNDKSPPLLFVEADHFVPAIVLANEDVDQYGKILNATTGVVFLGTPHRGASGTTDIGKVVGGIINAFGGATQISGFTGKIRTDLLETLAANSEALETLADSFRKRLARLDVVSFYETEVMPPLGRLIVERYSAVLQHQNERTIPLYANHRDIARFSGKTNEYNTVAKEIANLVQKAQNARYRSKLRSKTLSFHSLSDTEKECLATLSTFDVADYKADLPKPILGTCGWILSHPLFIRWISSNTNDLIWITGSAGCGKTTLSAFITEKLSDSRAADLHPIVCSFFCDDKIQKQKDAVSILKGMIYQLSRRQRSLFSHFVHAFNFQGTSVFHSFSSLWNIFLAMVNDQRAGPIILVIDAIDECEEKTRTSFLNAVLDLMKEPKSDITISPNASKSIKLFITSRPSLCNDYLYNGLQSNRLEIEEGQTGLHADIQTVVQYRVEQLVKKKQWSVETKSFLEQELYIKSERTFLWVGIVFRQLESTPLASAKDLERIINTLPQGLQAVYQRSLDTAPLEYHAYIQKALHILVSSTRNLNLAEFNDAFTISSDHSTLDELRMGRQPSIQQTLESIVPAFIRISNSRVSLVHQSAKEFLLGKPTDTALPVRNEATAGASQDFRSVILRSGIQQTDAALTLATSCVYYLHLEDFRADLFDPERSTSESSSPNSPEVADVDHSSQMLDDLFNLQDDMIFKEQYEIRSEVCDLLASRYDFFDYAAVFWPGHVSVCEMNLSRELRAAVRSLIDDSSEVFSNWFTYFWITAEMGKSVPEYMTSLVVASFFDLSTFVNDMLRERRRTQLELNRALFWAARMNSAEAMSVLLRNGAEPNSKVVERQSPLAAAAQHGYLDSVQQLLSDSRTDINFKGEFGRPPLSYAVANGHANIARILLSDPSCQVDEPDDQGSTPLLWAVFANHTGLLREILRNKTVNVNHTDRGGRSAISWAAGEGFLDPLKSLLKHQEVDPNIRDNKGRSPLSWAAGNGHVQAVKALMKSSKVDKASVDHDGMNAHCWACKGGHAEVLQLLIKYDRMGVDHQDVSGWIPLAWCADDDSLGCAEVLLDAGIANIDHQDHGGRTALSWAAGNGHLQKSKLLLERGADARLQDHGGRTPLDWAKAHHHTDIIELLEHPVTLSS